MLHFSVNRPRLALLVGESFQNSYPVHQSHVGGLIPWHELFNSALSIAVDDGREGCGEVGMGLNLSLHVSISDAMMPQFLTPASCPAKRVFFLFKAIGRIMRSTALLCILIRPSVRNRIAAVCRALQCYTAAFASRTFNHCAAWIR